MRKIDLLGQRFSRLVVIGEHPKKDKNGQARWVCKCDCGQEVICLGNNLRRGGTKSCGCLMKEVARECMVALRESINKRTEEQLVGQTFNRLTVIRFHNFDSSQQAAKLWLCKCACGKEVTVRTNALVTGRTKSCGCWRKESRMLEPGIGMRNHLLQIYKAAAKRRGHSWELVNEQFDVLTQGDCHYCGEPPSDRKHSSRFNGAYRCNGIDRKNNTKGYVFENCVSACWSCNRMKGTMSYDKFIAFLRKAGKFQLEKPNTASLSREAHAV